MWILYSVLCALSDSLASLFNKQLVSKKQDAFSVSVFIHGFGAITMLAIALATSEQLLKLPINALILLIFTAASAAAAGVILLLALKKGDLSLIAPIQTITPLLILVIAIFFLNETPRPIGLLGIVLIVTGGIFLDKSPKESFRSIMVRIVTYVFDKSGLKLVSVGVWIFYVYFFVFLLILPIVIVKKRKEFVKLKDHKALILSSSFFSVSAIYLQLLALKTALVTYVLSIKRLSSVFAVVLAYLVLNEKKALPRLKGAILMVAGAVLIGLS